MARFLLVHGSWHGAWCWGQVAKRLKRAGHQVRAIDLPGHGNDARDPANVTLPHYSAAIRAEVSDMGGDVILVGHSMGGVAISAACEDASTEISKLVFVAALVPGRNDTLLDLTARHIPQPGLLEMSVDIDGLVGVIKSDVAHELFYTDCPVETAQPFIDKLGPEPLMPMMTPINVSEKHFGATPKIYVECTKDKAIPIGAQRGMLRDAGISEVISLPSAHSPFLSMPDQLVDVLVSLEEVKAA